MKYADDSVLVSTEWVAERLWEAGLVLVEVDVDTKAFEAGHIPGAVGLNWETELQDGVRRDVVGKSGFEALLSERGVSRDDVIVLYGDNNNWFAAYAFWIFKLYGHKDVRLMNGGRAKWLAEEGRPLTLEATARTRTQYVADAPDTSIRSLLPEVLAAVEAGDTNLVDVRSIDEFTGKVIAPMGMNETAQRAGHIPGAKNVPWVTAVADDGTFKSADELRAIYLEGQRLDPSKPTIAYCRIGERSSHTWFVLRYLLGIENVTNYDGSWTEYGNLVGVPIENPSAADLVPS